MKTIVAIVTWSLEFGGTEAFLYAVIKNLNKTKFTPVIIVHSEYENVREKDFEKLGVKIIKIKDLRMKRPLKYIKNLKKIFISEKIDVVHANYYMSNAFALLAAQQAGVPVRIAHSHNADFTDDGIIKVFTNFGLKRLLNEAANQYLSCGHDAGNAMFSPYNNFVIINNGINLQEFGFNSEHRREIRKEFKIAEDNLVLLHVGRFEKQKNHTFLIDTFIELKKKQKEAKLILIGDGELRGLVRTKVSKSSIKDSVFFARNRKDINKIYSAADIFILPSRYEGFPVSLIEAQANGLNCLASDTIDKKTNITGKVKFLPLDGIETWIDASLKNSKRIKTKPDESLLRYDMKHIVHKLEKIYEDKK